MKRNGKVGTNLKKTKTFEKKTKIKKSKKSYENIKTHTHTHTQTWLKPMKQIVIQI